MASLDDYVLREALCETALMTLRRAMRKSDGEMVLLKLVRFDAASDRDLQRLHHEFAIKKSLTSPFVLRALDLKEDASQAFLVLQNFDGIWMQDLMGRPMELERFLDVAVRLAEALADIHEQGIIHGDIRPGSVLIQPGSWEIRLVEFGIASHLAREPTRAASREQIEGTPAYMSPEQTGRVNRWVDQRSDLYSLGVSFYQMLTGDLPFHASDLLEWVHSHLARQPRAPDELVSAIPTALSGVVLRLMEKEPDDRYQTARGLWLDLKRCRDEFRVSGRISPFLLGEQDISSRFSIPQRMIGREKELGELLEMFGGLLGQSKPGCVLITGDSGVGKSTLARELRRPTAQARGWFLTGKFDQFARNTPYSVVARAFRELARDILAQSEDRVAGYRRDLALALGGNGRIIAELIPEIEWIIGRQMPVSELPIAEAQNRFEAVFRRFVGVFATKEHPLVLLLDDMQWADAASLALLKSLLTHPDTEHVYLVGVYRQKEVGVSHPLSAMLGEISRSGVSVRTMALAPLSCQAVREIVQSVVRAHGPGEEELARLVCEKTAGNPFFVVQFLTALFHEGLLAFDSAAGTWKWNAGQIARKGFTENVADLVVRRLDRLPAEAREGVCLAACLGNTVESRYLAIVRGRSESQIHSELQPAVAEGTLLRIGDSYRFSHDHVQRAAYLLLPKGRRAEEHLRIGRSLERALPPEKLDEDVFAVVNQFNLGAARAREMPERVEIAELNLRAAQKAKASTAYASAVHYCTAGIGCLSQGYGPSEQELLFQLHLVRAQCQYLRGRLRQCAIALKKLDPQALTRLQKASISSLRIALHTTRGEMDKGIDAGIEGLRLFGKHLPARPTRAQVEEAYAEVWKALGDRPIEDLINQPAMAEAETRMAMSLLADMGTPAIFARQSLLHLTLAHMVRLSISQGNSDASAWAYAWFGATLVQRDFARYPEGVRFGKLAYELVRKNALNGYRAKVCLMYGDNINFYAHHLRTDRQYIHEAFHSAVENGDLIWACYSCNHLITNMLSAGDPLAEVWEESGRQMEFARKAGDRNIQDIILSQQRFIASLRGTTNDPLSFSGDGFEEEEFESRIQRSQMPLMVCWYYILKLQSRLMFEDYAGAIDAMEKAGSRILASGPDIQGADYDFFAALAMAGAYSAATESLRKGYLEAIAGHERFLRTLADQCPENFATRYQLVRAERCRITDNPLEAEHLYELAINSAHASGFVHHEALASECASRFYRERELETLADAHLRRSHLCYGRWGAKGKRRQLEQRHPELGRTLEPSPPALLTRVERLDVQALVKALQAISRTLLLPDLQQTLLRIVLEFSGAQRAVLLLAKDGEFQVHAIAQVEGNHAAVKLLSPAPISSQLLPLSVFNMVRRSARPRVLNNAAESASDSGDEYIRRWQPRSILCYPLVRQGRVVGMLYLENNLLSGAFGADVVTTLELLAAQTAISLQNAMLYADLQEENAERRRAQAIVRDSDERLQLALSSAEIGTWDWDLPGGKVVWDKNHAQLFGMRLEDFDGTLEGVKRCVHPEDRERMSREIEEALTRKRQYACEYRVVWGDGSIHWISGKGKVYYDENGRPVRMAGTVMDISRRKMDEAQQAKMAADVRQAKDVAENASRAKDQFIAMLSHELRTPLAPVLAVATALEDQEDLPAGMRTDMELIHRNVELETRLIDDLLDFTRINRGTISLRQEVVNAHECLLSALEICRSDIEDKRLRVVKELSAGAFHVWADPARLQQVFWNLLKNAAKFTPLQGQITLRSWNEQGRLKIEVADTGIGIEPEMLPRVFNAFEQAEHTRMRRFGGMGLGLTIAKGVIDLHHGQLTVTSEGKDKGAAFTVDLAASAVEDELISSPPVVVANVESRKLLLVEDHPDTLRVMANLLRRRGFAVTTAASVADAIEKANREHFDLLISDIGLPDGSGLQVMRELRDRYGLKGIALSGYGTESDVLESQSAGFERHLTKPINFLTLGAVVSDVLSGHAA